jgi:putative iron-only hydrogenase system regulator
MADIIAGVTILVTNRKEAHSAINEILSQYGSIIAGRMGIPHLAEDRSVITLILQGDEVAVNSLLCELTTIENAKGFRTVLAQFEA